MMKIMNGERGGGNEPPTYGQDEKKRNMLTCNLRLAQLDRYGANCEVMMTSGKILQDRRPHGSDTESDDPMGAQIASARLRGYNDSGQDEVSDPQWWATLHYGPPSDSNLEEGGGMRNVFHQRWYHNVRSFGSSANFSQFTTSPRRKTVWTDNEF